MSYISFHFPFIESNIYHWHHRCIVSVLLLSNKQLIKIQATCIRFLLWCMGLLPDTKNCGLCLRREWRERFTRHWLQRKPLISHPSMHHGTCVTHVPWCMSVSLTYGGGENVPVIPGACATRNFTYLVRGPWFDLSNIINRHKVGITAPFPVKQTWWIWVNDISKTKHMKTVVIMEYTD